MARKIQPTARDERPVGIYIHIPFCRRKCSYCDFYSIPTFDDALCDRYAAALVRQIAETAPTVAGKVDSVYFGGGTPTVFGAKRLCAVLGAIHKHFTVEKTAEITTEANPESTDKKTMKALRRAGFNRVSFGVQSSCDAELRAMGRLHDFSAAKAAVEAARAAKFKNVSVDLMYGVEGQTAESWRRSIADILALKPEHISAYGLKVESGTPLARAVEAGDVLLPDDDTQAEYYETACELLRDAEYVHYEISNWAKPGYESRHNLRYWRLEPYIGFGAAAHSDAFGIRCAAPRDIEKYMTAVESGGEIFEDYDRIPPSERAFEYVMLALRTGDGIDAGTLRRSYRLDPDAAAETIDALAEQGLVARTPHGFRLTERGALLSNTLILKIFDALKPLENRFAKEKL